PKEFEKLKKEREAYEKAYGKKTVKAAIKDGLDDLFPKEEKPELKASGKADVTFEDRLRANEAKDVRDVNIPEKEPEPTNNDTGENNAPEITLEREDDPYKLPELKEPTNVEEKEDTVRITTMGSKRQETITRVYSKEDLPEEYKELVEE
ncbi:MAG: hypothetical protein ACQEP1_03595, partial [Nanobdellota archaeon]